MLIESVIRSKKKPSRLITLFGTDYEFKPDATGRWVCDIDNPDHINTLLLIPEGYRQLAGEPVFEVKPRVQSDATPPIALLGSSVHPSEFTIGNQVYTLGDIVGKSFASFGLTPEEWNQLAEGIRHDAIDQTLDALQASAEQGAAQAKQHAAAVKAERAELAAQYKEKFGKAPGGQWDAATLRAKLQA